MLYLHDIWVNWFEGEENEYNVLHFHEWRKDDGVDLLDQVPVVKVTSELFDSLTNSMNEIPEPLLRSTRGRAYLRKKHERHQMKQCFCVTDGVEVMVIDTEDLKIPLKKSRLIPRQITLALEVTEYEKALHYEFESVPKSYDLLNLSPELVVGLTRRERSLKQLLGMAIDGMKNASVEKVRYYSTEWESVKYSEVIDKNKNELIEELVNKAMKGWSKEHEVFLEKIVKNDPFLIKLYEMEIGKELKSR